MSTEPMGQIADAVDWDGLTESAYQQNMIDVGGFAAPEAPTSMYETCIDPEVLADLTLRMAYTMPHFTTEMAARHTCLPSHLVCDLLEQLREDKLIEVLGESGLLGYRFGITVRGRERAERLMEVCGYVGPAPVSIEAYTRLLKRQFENLPAVSAHDVAEAIGELVLDDDVKHIAGLACFGRRSLFLHGPPGNGKTSLGKALHSAFKGELWIPYCIGADNNIIRLFDVQEHEPLPLDVSPQDKQSIDHRWVRIRRPLIIVGGEFTLDALDLKYHEGLRFYEAPLHMKANGGTFLLDDIGYQRVEPHELLGRWIYPMEHHVDHMTLHTGQKLEVPFEQMLIASTNQDPQKVMDPAFLRRIGYRVYLGDPTPQQYAQIFHRYARQHNVAVPDDLLPQLMQRYEAQDRPLRGCEPRDLIERMRDICEYHNEPFELNGELLDVAWHGYFGDRLRKN